MMKPNRAILPIVAVAAALALNACATSGVAAARSRLSSRAVLSPKQYALRWTLVAEPSEDSPRLELGADQTVGVSGILGQTVNEVVPIPGTDMIRVGALQEGSLFQTSFRSPQQEGTILSEAIIVFRITRPVWSW